jgi:hypothetical protein
MASNRQIPSKRRVYRFTLAQLLEHGIFRDSWKEVDVRAAARVVRDSESGKKVGLSRSGMSVGYSVQSAAKELNVSKQRVHQLLNAGVLEAYELLDDAKQPSGLFITPASLAAFESSDRRPGPKKKASESSVKGVRAK